MLGGAQASTCDVPHVIAFAGLAGLVVITAVTSRWPSPDMIGRQTWGPIRPAFPRPPWGSHRYTRVRPYWWGGSASGCSACAAVAGQAEAGGHNALALTCTW